MIGWVLLSVFLVMVGIPLTVYLCIRMGTYGYLRAHEAFRRQTKKRKGPPRNTPWENEFSNDN